MPIKRLFNRNENHEILLNKIAELEKKQLKLNAIEVQIKKLLNLEEKIYPLLKLKDQMMKEVKSTSRHKEMEGKGARNVQKDTQSAETAALRLMIPILNKIDVMNKQILGLERNNAIRTDDTSTLKKVAPILNRIDLMDKQILELEGNISQVNESQTIILSRLDQIEETLLSMQKQEQQQGNIGEQAVIIKEFHIDKFYLDKYEQNNNFGQLGIKQLSGALNIGATYGREVIPKEFTDQIKEDINEMKGIKKEFDSNKNNEEIDDLQNKEEEQSSSYDSTLHDEAFTEIPIEFFSEDESS